VQFIIDSTLLPSKKSRHQLLDQIRQLITPSASACSSFAGPTYLKLAVNRNFADFASARLNRADLTEV
jgi:hypothetical protein